MASAAAAAQAAQEVALRGDGSKNYLGLRDVRAQAGLCARGRAQEGQVLDPSWELGNYTSARLLPWRDLWVHRMYSHVKAVN